MAKPLFAAKEAKKVNVFGADVYLTMPRAAGRTEVSLLDVTAHPGDGPPLHVHHNEDEISRVLKGRYRLRIGEETVEPGPGGTLVMPRDLPHCYGSGVVQPGGFEQFFLDVIAEGLQVPADIGTHPEIAAR
jgi:mannose-6-phosphate isomerase-like protein (cupin superfamily)